MTKVTNLGSHENQPKSGQFRVTSYKKGLKKCFFENLGERPIEMY